MPLPRKKFCALNEGFICANCHKEVLPTSGSIPRNHCPFCLWCRHVDINPGDRANPCQGMMRPIGIYTHTKKTYIILHQCMKCGTRVKAKAVLADEGTVDDFNIIVELAGKPIYEK